RWSRNVRDATGKTSGEMSRVTVAQCPRNRQAAADTLSPDDRRDDSQDNWRYADVGRAASAWKLARQPTICSRNGGATAVQQPTQNPASNS
ncbi:MAG TPA: hypothetical protein VMJ12_18840, partial [Candidatus Acidoferrales bacterium]|nr:hypothetical protein [Candidatus Acidoferrales bacterium]